MERAVDDCSFTLLQNMQVSLFVDVRIILKVVIYFKKKECKDDGSLL